MNLVKIWILFFSVAFSFQNTCSETLGLSMNSAKQMDGIRIDNKHQTKLADSVKITVSNNSSEIIKDESFLITFAIENRSEERISLNALPMVILQKKGILESEIDVKENQFYTFLDLPNDSEFMKKEFLEPEDKVEFEVDITKSKWGYSIQANLPSSNIFNILPKGEYDLFIKFRTSNSESDNKNINYSISNSLSVYHK